MILVIHRLRRKVCWWSPLTNMCRFDPHYMEKIISLCRDRTFSQNLTLTINLLLKSYSLWLNRKFVMARLDGDTFYRRDPTLFRWGVGDARLLSSARITFFFYRTLITGRKCCLLISRICNIGRSIPCISPQIRRLVFESGFYNFILVLVTDSLSHASTNLPIKVSNYVNRGGDWSWH